MQDYNLTTEQIEELSDTFSNKINMTLEIEYNSGTKEILNNVNDFYSTGNKYILYFSGLNQVRTINIADVKSYKKL